MLSDQLNSFSIDFKVCQRRYRIDFSPGYSGLCTDCLLYSTEFPGLVGTNSNISPCPLTCYSSWTVASGQVSKSAQHSVRSLCERMGLFLRSCYICHSNSNFHRIPDLLILYQRDSESLLGLLSPVAMPRSVLQAEGWDNCLTPIINFPYLRNYSLALHAVQ